MAEEIAFENGRMSNFEGLVTLTLNRVILHTVVHHSSTSTYMLNFTEIEETYCRQTYVRTHAHFRPTYSVEESTKNRIKYITVCPKL